MPMLAQKLILGISELVPVGLSCTCLRNCHHVSHGMGILFCEKIGYHAPSSITACPEDSQDLQRRPVLLQRLYFTDAMQWMHSE